MMDVFTSHHECSVSRNALRGGKSERRRPQRKLVGGGLVGGGWRGAGGKQTPITS